MRQLKRTVKIGNITIGGTNPIAVQTMLNVPVKDIAGNVEQAKRVAKAGCQIVRVTVPTPADAAVVSAIKEAVDIPVVADIHFDYRAALAAIDAGADKIRINPGNIGDDDRVKAVADACNAKNIPIRIGVNAGSLDQDLAARRDLTLPQKLAASAAGYVEYCEGRGFHDLVVSAKAHDVMTTVRTYRQLSRDLPHIPLHIGITEAGTQFQGVIKSASGLGILLEEGIGDTMRISLTDDPVVEMRACWALLSALDLRRRGPEIISCPTCGRCQVNLIELAKQVESNLMSTTKPIKVAVMGCVVNGPGEARDADIGVACGAGVGVVFKHGEVQRKVEEHAIVDVLMEEIGKL